MKLTSILSALALWMLASLPAQAQNDIILNQQVGTTRNGDRAVLETTRTSGKDRLHVITHSGDGGSSSSTTTTPKQYSGTPSNYAVATTNATVFTLAAGEIGFIQNLDDAPLCVKKGASASSSSFSFILGPGVAADDGKGGYTRITDWIGVVSVAAQTGTARYIAWKQAPLP